MYTRGTPGPIVWALLLCSSPAVAQQAPRRAGDLSIETRTLEAAGGTMIEADVGRLVVPENRSRPGSKLIELAFVRLRSSAEEPKAPLIYLAGGPGGSSTHFAENPGSLQNWLAVLAVSDVILLDQRATGKSTPTLRYEAQIPIPEDVFVYEQVAVHAYGEAARAAADYFRSQGVDLDGYNSNESADDINDLRLALGYEKISLMGFSYGTHLALATIRRHGEHLENVIAIGVEGLHQTHKLPLNMDTQLGKVAILVARDERVGPYVPDLVALTKRVFAKLEREPMVVEIPDRRTGEPVKMTVGKFGLQVILRRDIGDASDLPVFPKLLHSIDQGDPSVLAWFVEKRRPSTRINLMGLLVDGASGASPERWALIDAQAKRSIFGAVANFPWPHIDEATGVRDLGEDYRAPLVSDVRTLFLTGSLDFNTPPYQAEQIRWGMPNATHLVVENAGHEQILPQPAVQRAIVRFLEGEDVSDVKVVLPPLRFVPIEGYDPEVSHPSASLGRMLLRAAMTNDLPIAFAEYRRLKERHDLDTEGEINTLGYELLRRGYMKEAIAFLTMNVEDYPDSWNAYDSLAEAYKAAGDRARSIELYEKSLELNPDNTNGIRMLKELGAW